MWTQKEASWMLAALELELIKREAHCGLTGSVLYRGESIKDLDVIIYPRHKKGDGALWDVASLQNFLVEFFDAVEIKRCTSQSQDRDDKMVCWLRTKSGKRIDFFFLQ